MQVKIKILNIAIATDPHDEVDVLDFISLLVSFLSLISKNHNEEENPP